MKIYRLLANMRASGSAPLDAAVAAAVCMAEEGDMLAGNGRIYPLPILPESGNIFRTADPGMACGAALALKRKNAGALCVACAEDGARLEEALSLAKALELPLIFLVSCSEAARDALSSRVMALDVECIPADGRSVMALMPALRLALDKAREGDGPTLIECVPDRPPEEEDAPEDALDRLRDVLILEGYAAPEELT